MYSSPFSIRQSWKWFVFTFLAGSLNAGAMIACGKFVTHTTGSMTLFGVQLAVGGWRAALGLLSLPIYFVLGAILSAVLIDRRQLKGLQPLYWVALLIVTFCIVLIPLGSQIDFFGDWDQLFHSRRNIYVLILLSLASGLQNATISTASGAAIRTTHLTGITTDLGTGLVRILLLANRTQNLKKELRMIWMRLGTLLAFACGATIGSVFYLEYHYQGFWLPAVVSAFGVALSFQSERKLKNRDTPH